MIRESYGTALRGNKKQGDIFPRILGVVQRVDSRSLTYSFQRLALRDRYLERIPSCGPNQHRHLNRKS